MLRAGRTRILVTHQRQYLPKCDKVAVLRHGRLVACGPYEQLAAQQLPELVGGAVSMSLDAADEHVQQADTTAAGAADQQSDPGSALATATQPARTAGKQQQEQVVSDGGASSSSSAEEDSAELFGGAASGLSRIRTMAPDVNRRPADSGRVPALNGSFVGVANGGSSGGGAWWRGASLARSFSRLGSGFFRQGSGHGAATAASRASSASGWGNLPAGAGGWATFKLRLHRSVAGLFTPPAYLPGGALYEAPASSRPRLVSAASGTAYSSSSRKGLAMLGPVRSMVGWQAPLAPSYSAKHAGVVAAAAANGGSMAAAAASAAAASGQLVLSEGRETGSVSWRIYGIYAKKIGVVLSACIFAGLVVGQGLMLAAEWWLALWSIASPAEQSKPK
jgi:hypothetical protein